VGAARFRGEHRPGRRSLHVARRPGGPGGDRTWPYDGLSWPEYFHILTNIEQNGEFLPKAKEIARGFFARANYDADDNYQPFDYSPDALDQRMKAIYDAYTETMNEPSRMDSGKVEWPVVVGRDGDRQVKKLVTFQVGKFSDRAVKERLRQRAPFNLVDGAWLQRIQAAGPAAASRVAVAPSVRAARREFAAKRKLIGMGAVH
jgi:hypothetical protein